MVWYYKCAAVFLIVSISIFQCSCSCAIEQLKERNLSIDEIRNNYGINVDRKVCNNETIFVNFSYFLPSNVFESLYVYVFKDGEKTSVGKSVSIDNLFSAPNGTGKYVIHGRSYLDSLLRIQIIIYESDCKYFKDNGISYKEYFNFSSELCNRTETLDNTTHKPHQSFTVPIIVSLSLFGVILAVSITLCFHVKYNIKRLWKDRKKIYIVQQPEKDPDNTDTNVSDEHVKNGVKTPNIYVLYINDHKKHQQVVVNFVYFLQADLGFNVFFELFETEAIAADPSSWLIDCLDRADKVIVIWSPGAETRWNQYNSNEGVGLDLFSPILKVIRNDIRLDKNVGKYFFGYFNYCKKEDIPSEFLKSSVLHFKLMNEFEDMYFRLKGIEKYLPGAIVNEEKVMFEHYFEPGVNQYGFLLESSIGEMRAVVSENPNWFLEDCTPLKLHVVKQAIVSEECDIHENYLNLLPPVILPSSSSIASTRDRMLPNTEILMANTQPSAQQGYKDRNVPNTRSMQDKAVSNKNCNKSSKFPYKKTEISKTYEQLDLSGDQEGSCCNPSIVAENISDLPHRENSLKQGNQQNFVCLAKPSQGSTDSGYQSSQFSSLPDSYEQKNEVDPVHIRKHQPPQERKKSVSKCSTARNFEISSDFLVSDMPDPLNEKINNLPFARPRLQLVPLEMQTDPMSSLMSINNMQNPNIV